MFLFPCHLSCIKAHATLQYTVRSATLIVTLCFKTMDSKKSGGLEDVGGKEHGSWKTIITSTKCDM